MGFDQDELDVLKKAKLNGRKLLAYQKVEDLFSDFEEATKLELISKSSLRALWPEIEKLNPQANKPTALPPLSIESHLQNSSLDTLSKAVQRDNDEQALRIQLLMTSIKKPALSESATNDHTMPFKDRATEAEELRSCIEYNLVAYDTNSRRKNDYYFTAVTSGTGFGKTRFCKEIPNLIKLIPKVC